MPPTILTNFISTKHDLIKMSFALLNVFGADEEIGAEDYNFAGRMLNMLVKNWMDMGYNLWLKKTAYLFTKKNQNTYVLSYSNTDNSTLQYYANTLALNAATSATSVTLTSVDNISINDYFGILLDDNDIYWTKVLNIIGNVIYFYAGGALPSPATAGAKTYSYTTKLDPPLDIYQGVRNDDGLRDIPLNSLSYNEYMNLPNKIDSMSTPVSYQYDRQLDETIIRIWPTPDKSDVLLKFIIGQKVTNLDQNSDEADFPDEWQLPIIQKLAVLLAPAYGKNKDQGYANLVQDAAANLAIARAFDNEVGSVFFQPNVMNS